MAKDLNDLKGKNADAFRGIPDHYFDNLPDSTMKAISEKEKASKKFYLKPVFIGVAASLMILIGFAVLMLFNTQSPESGLLSANDKPIVENELIVYNDKTPGDLLKDSVKMNGQDPEKGTFQASGQPEDLDNLFATLDDVPLDIIIEYLVAAEEFSF
jgi:hypothetical protein